MRAGYEAGVEVWRYEKMKVVEVLEVVEVSLHPFCLKLVIDQSFF